MCVQKKGTIVLPVFIEDGDDLEASLHSTQLSFMVMSSVWCVSLISSSAAQVTPVKQITTWLLDTNEADRKHLLANLAYPSHLASPPPKKK